MASLDTRLGTWDPPRLNPENAGADSIEVTFREVIDHASRGTVTVLTNLTVSCAPAPGHVSVTSGSGGKLTIDDRTQRWLAVIHRALPRKQN
jgi:hypothetical protein